MRRTLARVTVWGAVAAGLIHALTAQALGLGEISVDSLLNQRFSAVIPLTEIDAEDLETVSVTVASADAYDRAGLERVDYLDSLEFKVSNDRGQPRVVVTSGQIAREPVVNLLVQARWAGGRILREYTVLLDPPQLVKAPIAPPPVAQPVPVPVPAPAPVVAPPSAPVIAAAPKPKPEPVAPVRAPAPPPVVPTAKPEPEFYETATEGGQPAPKPAVKPKPSPAPAAAVAAAMPVTGEFYGPVQAQETLWSIATKLRPSPAVSMDQVMYALALANPKTIQRGTTVNKGASLAVPSAATMGALSPAEAKAKLAALRGAAGKPATPAAAASSSPKPVATAPAQTVAPPPKPPASPPPAPPKPAASAAAVPAPTPAPAPAPAATKPGKSVLDAPAGLSAAPAAKPVVPPAPEPKPEIKPEPKPEPKPELKPEVPAVAVTPAPAPAPEPVADKPVAAPVPPPAPSPTAESPSATAPAAEPEMPTPTEPAPSEPELAQSLPDDADGGLAGFLSAWGVPIGGVVVLLLGALFVVKRLGERAGKAGRPSKSGGAGSGSRASSFAASAAATGAGMASKLDDTQVTPARAMESTQALEQTQAVTQQITQRIGAEATGEMRPSAFESTLIIEPDVAAGLRAGAQPSAVGQSKTDFDMTTQLQAETMHISLDANDPISEADFHLAYGLYDEAILLLKQALAKTPGRTDVQVKLAETYFAAGKAIEFQTLAEDLKPQLDAGEWSKLAIMGSQLCPGVTLFKSSGDADLAADFDLGFDDAPAAELSLELPPEPPPPPKPVVKPAEVAPLAFELPDVSIPAVAEFTPASPDPLEKLDANIKLELEPELSGPAVPEEDPSSIDFMLGQSITPLGAAGDSPAPALDANLLEFDLDSSLNSPAPSDKPLPGMVDDLDFQLSVSPSPPLSLDEAARDLQLEQFSVSLTPREVSPGTLADEFNTKLDLARAYVEMGDNEMARGLLQEVQQQGNEAQQREAGEMLQRLPA